MRTSQPRSLPELRFASGLSDRELALGALASLAWTDGHGRLALRPDLVFELSSVVGSVHAADGLVYGLPDWMANEELRSSPANLAIRARAGGQELDVLFGGLIDDADEFENAVRRFSVAKPPRDEYLRAVQGEQARGDLVRVREAELRASVQSFPIAHVLGTHGALLGLKISKAAEPGLRVHVAGHLELQEYFGVSDWDPLTPGFIAGVRAGRAAAVRWLEASGAPPSVMARAGDLDVEVRGLLPPMQLHDRSAGLAVAVATLQIATEMSIEKPRTSYTGGFGDDGSPVTMAEEVLKAKENAIAADTLHTLGAMPDSLADLEAAVEHAFPGGLRSTRTRWFLDTLRSAGLERASWSPESSGYGLPAVRTRHATELVQRIVNGHDGLVVLGGPANSGKTWILADVATRLRSYGFEVSSFVASPGRLDLGAVETAIRSMCATGDPSRSVVIIDGLQWTDDDESVIGTFQRMVTDDGGLGAALVLGLRSDHSTRWRIHSDFSVASIISRDDQEQFIASLVRESGGDSWADLDRLQSSLRAQAAGDLDLLAALVAFSKRLGGTVPMQSAIFERRIAWVQPGQWTQLCMLASLSSMGVPCPVSKLDQLSPDRLRELGARPLVEGYWELPSRLMQEVLLDREAQSRFPQRSDLEEASKRIVVRNVQQHIRGQVEASIAGEVVWRDLVRDLAVLRTSNADLFEGLARSLSNIIATWTSTCVDLEALVAVLSALGDSVSRDYLIKIAPAIERLWSPGELSLLAPTTAVQFLMLVDRYGDSLPPAFCEEVRAEIRDQVIPRSLAGPWTQGERMAAARALSRMRDERADRMLVANIANLIEAPESASAYRSALQLLRLVERSTVSPAGLAAALGVATGPVPPASVRDALSASLPHLPEFAQLLDAPLPSDPSFEHTAYRAALRRRLGREDDLDSLTLGRSAEGTSLANVTSTLTYVSRHDRTFAFALASLLPLAQMGRDAMPTSSAGQFADYAWMLLRLSPPEAVALLYELGSPSSALAKILARTIAGAGLGDPKGAGMALKAAAAIDEWEGRDGDGFAHLLVEELGAEFIVGSIAHDARTTVLGHLLEGVALAQPLNLPSVQQRIRQILVKEIKEVSKERAPRLALRLGSDAILGSAFIEELAQDLNPDLLVRRAMSAESPGALAAFHQLGLVMHPSEFAQQFAREIRDQEDPFKHLRHQHKAHVRLQAAAAITDTLVACRDLDPGRTALILTGIYTPKGALAEPNLLQRLNPGTLAECVGLLGNLWPSGARHILLASTSAIARELRRAVARPREASELLSSVRQVAPDICAELIDGLRSTDSWAYMMQELAAMDEPRSQAQALKMFASVLDVRDPMAAQAAEQAIDSWSEVLGSVTSPAVAADLLTAAAAWDRESAGRMLGLSNASGYSLVDRVSHRLGRKHVRDIEKAPTIVRLLLGLGRSADAHALLDQLGPLEPFFRRLPVRALADLVVCVGLADRADLLLAASTAASRRVQFALLNGRAVDASTQHISCGWISHEYARIGTPLFVADEPPVFGRGRVHPQVELWAYGWLDRDADWVEARVHAGLARQLELGPPGRAWACAAVLTVALAWRHDDAFLNDDYGQSFAASWNHIEALLDQLELVFEARSSELFDLIFAVERPYYAAATWALARANANVGVPNLQARRVEQRLEALLN